MCASTSQHSHATAGRPRHRKLFKNSIDDSGAEGLAELCRQSPKIEAGCRGRCGADGAFRSAEMSPTCVLDHSLARHGIQNMLVKAFAALLQTLSILTWVRSIWCFSKTTSSQNISNTGFGAEKAAFPQLAFWEHHCGPGVSTRVYGKCHLSSRKPREIQEFRRRAKSLDGFLMFLWRSDASADPNEHAGPRTRRGIYKLSPVTAKKSNVEVPLQRNGPLGLSTPQTHIYIHYRTVT